MAKMMEILGELDLKTLETAKKKAKTITKTVVKPSGKGRQLINNLLFILNRRENTMVEMKGFFVERVRIPLNCDIHNPKKKGLYVWAYPFPQGNFLMLRIESPAMLAGLVVRASLIFGDSINLMPPRNNYD